jgi:hypothetical protein
MIIEKYTESLRLMDLVIAAKSDQDACNKAWDELFNFIFANFAKPEFSDEEVKELKLLLKTPSDQLESLVRTISSTISEQLWPPAIARCLLVGHIAPLRPSELKTFSQFHSAYGGLLIRAGGTG